MKSDLLKTNTLTLADALAILIITIVSVMGINPYVYGKFNHEITVPFLKYVVDPSLYPGDYLIAELKYFFTYFLSGMTLLVKTLHVSIPALFFSLYIVSLYFTFFAAFKISLALFNRKESAYFALFLMIFAFDTLGDVRSVESMFLERSFTLPILLFSIYFYLKEKYYASYIIQGIAFLVHPLSAMYVIGFLFVASLFRYKEIGMGRMISCIIILTVFAAPAVMLKMQNPAPSLHLIQADSEWVSLLRLRSSHHLFPFSWAWKKWLFSALFLAGFAIAWKHRPVSEKHHKIIQMCCGTILLMCIGGTILTEFYPVSIILQFQLFRSFQFFVLLALLYYANYFFCESKSLSNLAQKILVALLLAGIYYGDNIPKFASFLVVVFSIFPVYNYVNANKISLAKYFIPAVILMLTGIGIAGNMLGKNLTLHQNFTIQSSANKDWLDIQRWAKAKTEINDAFIVPPNWTGFRVESERSIYGDWKDGTQMFFNPDFGVEWIRRMKMLGYVDDNRLEETYRQLHENDFNKIASELKEKYKDAFIVMPVIREKLNFPEVYSNGKFVVYKAGVN